MNKCIKRRKAVEKAQCFDSPHLPAWLIQLYAMRGVRDLSELETGLDALLPYHRLLHIEAAATGLADFIQAKKSILIIGDYDADGATSTALALTALRAMGHQQVDFMVPDRFKQGYGLSEALVREALKRKPQLIITVDNGISNHAGVTLARAAGVAVLITDHHLPAGNLPDANWIVNPNQPGCFFQSKNLAGVGVIFYVLLALRQQLIASNWFETIHQTPPNMAQFLDLVALGTVADVVPLDKNNRILVEQGLRRIRQGVMRPGIAALIEIAKRNPRRLRAADVGFALGPRLNAAGRLEDMSIGIQCLLAPDLETARHYALQLNALNEERKGIEANMQQQAFDALQECHVTGELPPAICAFQPNWHQGVIGILASRLKDHYHRPTIAFAADGEILKGSARSISGVHIRDLLQWIDAHHPNLILQYGGHAMAAGLTVARPNYALFKACFLKAVTQQVSLELLSPVIVTDGALPKEAFSLAGAQALCYGGPWGQQFPEPLFDEEFEVLDQVILADKHLKLQLRPVSGGPVVDALWFFADLKAWPNYNCKRIWAVYRLDVNEYNGFSRVQLIIEWISE